MGTTLTGTKPKDTYDSLIKVGDNGPLSGTLKALSDGLGNDSALALSTGAASITGTLAVSGAVTAGTSTNVQATSTNTRLLVTAAGVANTVLGFNNSGSTENGVVNNAGYIGILQEYPFVVTIGDSERLRILANGGLTFNGDTAAANALDDYEEGTWTITATPQSSGTITLGTNGGTYTKIGRQVTCIGRAIVSSVASPVGSYVQFGGLPFTALNLVAAQSAPSVYFADASASYASSSIPSYLPDNLTVFYAFKDASTVAASDEIAFTITYFV
jgi:hypothetical protein